MSERKQPTLEGFMTLPKTILAREQYSNLSDRLGVAGVCLMFPEFLPIKSDISALIITGHYIDHIFDEGGGHILRGAKITNSHAFMNSYGRLIDSFTLNNQPALANAVSFMSQAATVESDAHSWNLDDERNTRYRELINAIWTRMVVSYGSGILNGHLDDAGSPDNATLSFGDLEIYYSPYIYGKDLNSVLLGDRSHVLYLWTMSIQSIFDDFNREENVRNGNPSMPQKHDPYFEQARDKIRPVILQLSKATISGVFRLIKYRS